MKPWRVIGGAAAVLVVAVGLYFASWWHDATESAALQALHSSPDVSLSVDEENILPDWLHYLSYEDFWTDFTDWFGSRVTEVRLLVEVENPDPQQLEFVRGVLGRLRRHPRLASVQIDWVSLNEEELARLEELPSLRRLVVTSSSLTHDAFPIVARHRNLDLLYLQIDRELDDERIADLAPLLSLTTLEIHGKPLRWSARIGELAALKHLKSLVLGDGDTSDDPEAAFAALAEIRSLESIDLRRHAGPVDGPLRALSTMPRLHSLRLSRTGLTDAGLVALGPLKTLRSIDVDGTRVKDEGLRFLCRTLPLTALNASGTLVDDAGLTELGRLTDLKTLALRGTRITNAGVASLPAFAGLDTLDLARNAISDEALPALYKYRGIELITLEGTDVTRKGLKDLEDATGWPRSWPPMRTGVWPSHISPNPDYGADPKEIAAPREDDLWDYPRQTPVSQREATNEGAA